MFLFDSNTKYLYNILFETGKDRKDFVYYKDNKTIAKLIVLRLLKLLNDEKKNIILMNGIHQLIYLTNYQTQDI